jgi:hypothetical protein
MDLKNRKLFVSKIINSKRLLLNALKEQKILGQLNKKLETKLSEFNVLSELR